MKYFLMYLALTYIIACADDVKDSLENHSVGNRIWRAIVWPWTLTSWFRTQNQRLHRLLNILWCLLISGWLLSLLADRL
jgi:hypothetical protein